MDERLAVLWALEFIAAAAYVAVAAVLFNSLRRRRRSTATTVLAWFGLLAIISASTRLLNANQSMVAAPLATLDFAVSATLLAALIVAAIALVRLIPRAVEFQDYRNLQAAADELRLSKERFQRAIDSSFSGLWEWNIDQGTVWYSSRFRQMLGYDAEGEFPNALQSWKSAIHADDWARVLATLDRHLEDQIAYDVEYRLRTRSGEYRWFSSRGLAIRDPAGRPYLMSGSLQDVHQRKQAEEAVRRQYEYLSHKQKMESLGELAGGAAHEFNNLLQAISGQIQFAERALPARSPARQELALAATLIEQASRFTRQLLDFSRRHPKDVEAIEPNAMIRRLEHVLRSMMSAQIEIKVRLGKRVGYVLCDSTALQQALLNLCINARDAMPGGGTITLRTRRARVSPQEASRNPGAADGAYAVLSVTDTGCGVSPEARARMFEPFYTTKAAGAGTGLGLAVADGVVKDCGGFIDVLSTPGKGSTFAIWLPVTPRVQPVATAESPTRTPARAPFRRATILYAEDNAVVRRTTAELLREAGHRVFAARDASEAICLFDEQPNEFDAALLDVIMPGGSGDEVFRHVRMKRPELPTIFCSGCASPLIDHDVPLTSVLTWLIDKPFTSDSLLTLLDEALAAAPEQGVTVA